ncbi:hypothetical protein ACVIU7_004356 [Bradyrhizobium liaoningense]|uniref:DUF2274 domain-containing protein n=1 Tax=Bradyrhizobium TaxID=374 RepID=UPI000404C727|nr:MULTISPECIES: DUF2274 domain-containing protein [Bradyrhizobium]WLB91369.1 DUF2274 domain-containing protein [Bradyrhizobium japonicum USDA 135]GLR99604.1 hypothetical protein GCM10007858_72500 [Bradyrhizobium liaoningense]
MPKLRIGSLPDDKPVKVTTELPASVHRDLVAYAEAVARENGQRIDPAKLIAPMLARFMATDRGFVKARRTGHSPSAGGGEG